jgi:hypothetical protein
MSKKLDTNVIREYMSQFGCVLTSGYVSIKEKIAYKCPCGRDATTTFDSFKASEHKMCYECRKPISSKRKSKTSGTLFNKVVDIYTQKGLKVISSKEDYASQDSILKYICLCGENDSISYNDLKRRKNICLHNKEKFAPKKRTNQEVYTIFRDAGCKIINDSFSYLKDSQKVEFLCNCDRIGLKTITSFIKKSQCNACSIEDTSKKNRKTLDDVFGIFESFGCLLISNTYKNERTPLNYICICGKDCSEKLSVMGKREMCKECSLITKNRRKYLVWKSYFEDNGCTLLTTECTRTDQKIKYLCKCGRVSETQYYRFIQGQRCMKCRDEQYNIGENSHAWKGGISTVNQKIRNTTEYRQWRTSVLIRDNGVCRCCETKEDVVLHVHHIKNFSEYEDLRFDVKNGIVTCYDCHSPYAKNSFHDRYTVYNNDIYQLQEYFDDIRLHLGLPLVSIEDIVNPKSIAV